MSSEHDRDTEQDKPAEVSLMWLCALFSLAYVATWCAT